MKSKLVYGCDVKGEITPVKVRDAIIECFFQAHKEVLDEFHELDPGIDEKELINLEKLDVELLVKKYFSEIDGDFDSPTKENLIKVIDKLREFSLNFRKPKIIDKHYNEIMSLINKLD